MKKTIAIMLLAALLLGLCACAKTVPGAHLTANIARVYTPENRTSRFVLNGTELEGSVIGKAYFDAAADGRTALAWVDTVLYFVSEKGVDSLGTDIGTAEISCDGKSALYLMGDMLYSYSLETRESRVVDTSVASVIQFAFSPHGECAVYTVSYDEEPDVYRTMLLKEGWITPVLEGKNAVVLAVSDDAKTIWYYDINAQALCAEADGVRTEVSKECGAATNYNFTNDLNEVIFSTDDSREIFYRLSDGLTCELGTGFGYSLKTDVYSISKVNLFAYVNDVNSFLDGFFMLRRKGQESYIYTLGYLSAKGAVKTIAEEAYKYLISADGKRVLWLGIDGLYSAGASGKAQRIAEDAVDIIDGGDGNTVYYQSSALSLFMIKGSGKPEKLDTLVESAAVFGGECWYIKEYKNGAGTLMRTGGGEAEKALENAARIDLRAGQLMIYADPVNDGTKTLYTLYIYTQETGLKLISEGVEP